MYFMGLRQRLGGLLYLRGFLKWNPGEKVGSGTGNASKKVQVGKDQEKAQSEKDSHSKNRGGKKLN